jgi:hypothetical protein
MEVFKFWNMCLFITDILYVHSFSIKLVKSFKIANFLENLLYCSEGS